MSLRRESQSVCDLLHVVLCGKQLSLDVLDQIVVDDSLRGLFRHTARHLSQVSAAYIQHVGIELYVAMLLVMLVHEVDEGII